MAETAKNGVRCLKMHSNVYFPKRAKKYQKMVKNGKKWLKIANNFKISQVTKYCEKNDKHVKKCQK